MTPEEKFQHGRQIMEDEQAKFAVRLDEVGATDRAIQVIFDLLNAEETKFFQKDGLVKDERTVVAHGARADGVKLLMAARGLKAPEKHEVKADLTDSFRKVAAMLIKGDSGKAGEGEKE